jgi:F-type H+-transporting ATPase subunit delta
MAEYKVSLRYANSLMDISTENKSVEKVSKDMELVLSAIHSSSDLRRLLEDPIIRSEKKQSVLEEIFEKKVSQESMNFMKFIVDKHREEFLENIIEKFLELRDEQLGIINVDVKTAFEFSEDQKLKLKNKLEKIFDKQTRLKFSIDKEIIGGFVAKINDTIYNASTKHQLEQLKKEFFKSSIQLN